MFTWLRSAVAVRAAVQRLALVVQLAILRARLAQVLAQREHLALVALVEQARTARQLAALVVIHRHSGQPRAARRELANLAQRRVLCLPTSGPMRNTSSSWPMGPSTPKRRRASKARHTRR
jgi:hypothetical protein